MTELYALECVRGSCSKCDKENGVGGELPAGVSHPLDFLAPEGEALCIGSLQPWQHVWDAPGPSKYLCL